MTNYAVLHISENVLFFIFFCLFNFGDFLRFFYIVFCFSAHLLCVFFSYISSTLCWTLWVTLFSKHAFAPWDLYKHSRPVRTCLPEYAQIPQIWGSTQHYLLLCSLYRQFDYWSVGMIHLHAPGWPGELWCAGCFLLVFWSCNIRPRLYPFYLHTTWYGPLLLYCSGLVSKHTAVTNL